MIVEIHVSPSAQTGNATVVQEVTVTATRTPGTRLGDRLAALPSLASLTPGEIASVAGVASLLSVGAGHLLTRQGRRGFEFFIVLSGSARCTVDGEEVARFGPGDFFGEMSLLDDGPRSATVESSTPMDLAVVDSREFVGMLLEAPSLKTRMLVTMSDRLRSAQVRKAQSRRTTEIE